MSNLMRVTCKAAVPALLLTIATGCSAARNATTVVTPGAPVATSGRATTDTPAPAAASSAGAGAAMDAATSGVDANLVKEGYRVVRRHDQILYCRSQSVTGTLFASTVCLTASQIADQRHELQQSKDLLNQAHATQCVGPECVGK